MTSLVFCVHSPLTFLLAPGVFIGLLWLFAPIDFNFPGDLQVLFYSIFIVFLFGLGLLCGSRQWRTVSVVVDVSPHRVRRLIYLLMIMGFGGLLLRAYERVFLRAGGEIGGDFMANRELFASGGGSSGLALFAGFFATWLMFLPCAVMLLRKTGDARWRYRLLALLSLAYPGFDMLLQGSRSTLVMYSGIVAVCFITLNRFRFTPRTLFMLVVSLVVLPFSFWLMGQVFAMRALQMGLDPIRSMTASGYAYFAPASAALVHYLNSTGMEGLNGFIYAYTHACQYLLHGMYEFFYVLANTNGSSTEGLQTFYIPSKILSKLEGGGDLEQLISDGMLRPGVYTTLWGPLVYDFGLLGALLASLVLGVAAGVVSRALCRGRVEVFPLYLLFFGFLIFAFVVNFFTSGTGQYSLYSYLLLCLLLRMRRYRLSSEARRGIATQS